MIELEKLPTFNEMRDKHFKGVWADQPDSVKAEIERLFRRTGRVLQKHAQGKDVTVSLAILDATLAHYTAGAYKLVGDATKEMILDYAGQAGGVALTFIRGALRI